MTTGIKRYGTFTEDAATKASELAQALSNNVFINAEPGINVFRFLPPLPGKTSIYRVTGIHYIDPIPGMQDKIVFACPRIESKESCPVCVKAHELGNEASKLAQEQAKRLQPVLRIMANVVDRKSPEPVVRIFSFGKTIFDALNAIRKNPRLGGDFSDPTENGFDIIIERTGTGMTDTRYTVSADRQNCPLHEDPVFMEQLIDMQYDLDRYVDPTLPAELALVLQALGGSTTQSVRHSRVAAPAMPSGAPALPARQPAVGVGAGLMSELRRQAPVPMPVGQTVNTTGSSALDYTEAEYDEDFNLIPKG